MSDIKQRTIKLDAGSVATLGPNLSRGLRTAAQTWNAAGRPELPADDRAGELKQVTRRWSAEIWEIITTAGEGNASAGARRLAAWMRNNETRCQHCDGDDEAARRRALRECDNCQRVIPSRELIGFPGVCPECWEAERVEDYLNKGEQ